MSEDLATGAAARASRAERATELPVIMDDTVAARLSVLGRTEDVIISPDGSRLAIACFGANRIAIVDFTVERDRAGDRPSAVLLTSVVMVDCLGLSLPHGLSFIDERRVLVANRAGELVLIDLPPAGCDVPCVTVDKRVIANSSSAVPVISPGSVTTSDAGGGLAEVLVCDNDASQVTRFVLDVAAGCEVLDGEVLLRKRLDIPDSITISPSGDWMAISNHWTNEVFLYRYDARLGPDDEPAGVLEGPNFPHGLRFSADGRRLAVADSGLPYVHTYVAESGDWSGRRQPVRSVRVMHDDEYMAGKYNFQEGGPKGLEIIDDGHVFVLTSEHQSLAFFDSAHLGWPSPAPPTDERVTRRGVASRLVRKAKAETAAVRADHVRLGQHSEWQAEVMLQQERTIAEQGKQLAELELRVAERSAAAQHLEAEAGRVQDEASAQREENTRLREELERLETSTSWRVTGPLRAAADRVKHPRGV